MSSPEIEQRIESLERLIHSHDGDELRAAAGNPQLTEELALALLKRHDLSAGVLQDLSKNSEVLKSRKVLVAMICHPRTPRFVSLPVLRSLFTFELLTVALQPAVPADLKMAIEQTIVEKIANMSLGERITLAKRGSKRVAERLLCDPDRSVVELALANPYLTEAGVVHTLMKGSEVDVRFVELVATHPKWSLRLDVRCALLRNPKTPMAVALKIVHSIPADVARDALYHSNLSANVKTYLMSEIQNRPRDQAKSHSR
jgi:hypothetical protein